MLFQKGDTGDALYGIRRNLQRRAADPQLSRRQGILEMGRKRISLIKTNKLSIEARSE
jgi:hypothetical protein